jgi:hypothetical protein
VLSHDVIDRLLDIAFDDVPWDDRLGFARQAIWQSRAPCP